MNNFLRAVSVAVGVTLLVCLGCVLIFSIFALVMTGFAINPWNLALIPVVIFTAILGGLGIFKAIEVIDNRLW